MPSLSTAGFVVLFGVCYLIYTIAIAYVLGVGRSMKRQFQISDCGLAWLYAAAGLGYACTVTLTAYYGTKRGVRRERLIAGGYVLVAAGCIVLVLSAFIASPPTVNDPQEEVELWKDAFSPLTRDEISTSKKLADTFWGRKIPAEQRNYLIDNDFRLEPEQKAKSMAKRWTIRHAAALENVKWHMGYDREDESMSILNGQGVISSHDRQKRQLPIYEDQFPDDLRDKIKDRMTAAVIGVYYWGDPYQRFAWDVYNITHDPEIFQRMMKAARLPFGYCRNATGLARAAIQRAACLERKATGSVVGAVFAAIGFALIGIGTTAVWTLGAVVLDDRTDKTKLAVVLGVLFGLQAIGFIIGSILGLMFEFRLYSNFNPPHDLTPIDPRWTGAWWLGFVVLAVLMALPAALMFVLDRHSKGNGNRTPPRDSNGGELATDRALVHENGYRVDTAEVIRPAWRDLIGSIFRVCRPPILVALLLALAFDALALKGYFDMLPKYYENNFSPSVLRSALPFWLYSIGIVVGAVVFRLARPDGRKAAICMLACTLLAAIFSLALSHGSFSCNNVVRRIQLQGLSSGSDGRPSYGSCVGCYCDPAEFYPVCANDSTNTPFYSPCHAGCTNFTYEIVKTSVEFHFDYCFCASSSRMRVSRDSCLDDCAGSSVGHLILSSLAALLSGSVLVPAVLFLLRASTYELRSMALALAGFVVCIFGFLPSTLIYRFVFDSTCFIRRSTCPDSSAHRPVCEIYDGPILRERLHLFLGVLRCISVLFYALITYHAKHVKLYLPTNRELIYATELRGEKNQNQEQTYDQVQSVQYYSVPKA